MTTLPRHWNAIVNPHSLRGGRPALWRRVKQTLTKQGFVVDEWESPSDEACRRIVRDLAAAGHLNLIVVGGDGTLNQVLNSLVQSGADTQAAMLALIPAGTGNDWARSHRIRNNARLLADMFLSGECFAHDIGCLTVIGLSGQTQRYFINIAGFGFDAEVIQRVQEKPGNKSPLVYIRTLLAALAANKPVNCRLVTDSGITNASVFTLAAGICKYNGNGMKMVPMADPGDGLLDVVYIEPMTRWEVMTQLPRLFFGRHVRFRKVHHLRTGELEIIPDGKMLAETEGEMAGEGNFVIHCLKQQIKILRPQSTG